MKAAIFLFLTLHMYSCYGAEKRQAPGSTPMMMVPPSPSLPPVQGSKATTDVPVTSDTDSPTPAPPMSSTAQAQTAGPSKAPSADCLDKRDDCRTFGASGCIGIYTSWAKYNCPRYCGYCINPNDTKVEECKDAIAICNEYGSEMCTQPEYRLFAEDNCKNYCNLCDSKPTANGANSGIVNMQPTRNQDADPNTGSSSSANGTVCKDTVDYCWTEPDSNCFGIYEPWARGHCPFRCGFCPEKPKCEDKLDYCSQYDGSACKDPSFVNWARLNCRKTCNLCALPTPPPGVTVSGSAGQTTGGSGNGGQTTIGNVVTTPTASVVVPPSNNPNNPPPSNTNVTTPSGTVTIGEKNTYIIQGPKPLVAGTCFYNGESHVQDSNWYDGCSYVCNCLDGTRNRIICTERCLRWQNTNVQIDGCSWVQESGDCCKRLECNAN